MKKTIQLRAATAGGIILFFGWIGLPVAWSQEADAPKVLLSRESLDEVQIASNSAQVTTQASTDPGASGLVMTIAGSPESYPGITITPKEGGVWNLASHGHVEAKVTNQGSKQCGVTLRVDNNADWNLSPFNAETVYIAPGDTKTISVIFGYTYGKKPGYKLDPAAVSKMLIFTDKTSETRTLLVESITAAGPAGETPPVDPASIRIKPQSSYLLGGEVSLDPAKQILARDGAQAALAADGKSVEVKFDKKGQSIALKTAVGFWDLREGNQVRVKLKNTGTKAIRPSVRVESKAGPTDKASLAEPLAPGTSTEIVASFIPAVPWVGVKDSAKTEWNPTPNTGTKFISDAAGPVTLISDEAGGDQKLEIESITLAAPAVELPEGSGLRPPVKGDWVQTFNEEFNGDSIDLKKWNIYTANYWDKKTGFSKDNVIVKNGMATLRYEKRKVRHNDDPNGKEFDYASGFLDTYGKWVQRYGYFESRMKLPKAPGLWPALWLMPDRGLAEGEQWKRADTGKGAMEFDIMEFLSRWGIYRFNIAFHWDGYGKEHKQTGTTTIYVDHDKDGFITTGLLWLPGKAVVYNNGKVVAEWESSRISNVPSDIMFTHVMGGWDNNGLNDTQLPDDFVIDYVRCWQMKDLATELDGVKSVQPTPAAPTKPDEATP